MKNSEKNGYDTECSVKSESHDPSFFLIVPFAMIVGYIALTLIYIAVK